MQLRLSTKYYVRFSYKGALCRWDPNATCSLCNLNESKTLYHFLFVCPVYEGYRSFYFSGFNLEDDPYEALVYLCNVPDDNVLRKFVLT